VGTCQENFASTKIKGKSEKYISGVFRKLKKNPVTDNGKKINLQTWIQKDIFAFAETPKN
jgi:hypothetical protein